MVTAKIKDGTTHTRIVRIDLDTAKYIIEKVQEAVIDTLSNNRKCEYGIGYDGKKEVLGVREKTTREYFETFTDNLQNILNEIKEKN